jgi:putative heme iron utilization protein
VAKEFDLDTIQTELQDFLEGLKTVQLATLDSENLPEASYAPYVKYENAYYLFLSDLAIHSINLKLNSATSLLFIEDEASSKNLFARRRVILQGEAATVHREMPTYTSVLLEFKRRFGSFIDVIEPLQDFNLYKVVPIKARFIRGFGQSFELYGENLIQIKHVNPGSN